MKMPSRPGQQLTVRGVSPRVVATLRRRARQGRVSLNQVLVEVLSTAAGVDPEATVHHDMDDLAGLWVEDPDFDAAIQAQDQVDETLWR